MLAIFNAWKIIAQLSPAVKRKMWEIFKNVEKYKS